MPTQEQVKEEMKRLSHEDAVIQGFVGREQGEDLARFLLQKDTIAYMTMAIFNLLPKQ